MSIGSARERRVRGAGVALHVVDTGSVDDRPLVVAHGVGSSSRFVLDAFGAPVTAAGLRLVTYDLRGHGGSDPVRDPAGHALDRHVEDLHAVVEAFGAELVGGVSLGGHATVSYAAAGGNVHAALACLPAWTGRAVPGEGPHAAVAADTSSIGVAGLVDGFRRDRGIRAWLREVLIRDWSAHDAESLRAALVALDGGLAPTEADLRSLPVPLAVVGWPHDPGHPLEVAEAWGSWAPRGHLELTSLDELDVDVAALGRAAVAALTGVGVTLPTGP